MVRIGSRNEAAENFDSLLKSLIQSDSIKATASLSGLLYQNKKTTGGRSSYIRQWNVILFKVYDCTRSNMHVRNIEKKLQTGKQWCNNKYCCVCESWMFTAVGLCCASVLMSFNLLLFFQTAPRLNSRWWPLGYKHIRKPLSPPPPIPRTPITPMQTVLCLSQSDASWSHAAGLCFQLK